MKIIAMYLPQFHRVPENDEWWGEGFTEWTAVKTAERLYEGHAQPRRPLNENYYDLMDKKTMQWQADLMHKYHVSGLCFYHYYFKDGRRILEKPAENLLRWKDIDMPFCFSWANESWARTWSRLSTRNIWTTKFEPSQCIDKNESGILLEQNYGGEDEWKAHFEYLLPFFMDDRYIKVNGKPVFIFYKPASIHCLERMIEFWRELAIKEGLPGLYLLGTNILEKGSLDGVLLQEPLYTLTNSQFPSRREGNTTCIDSRIIWNRILNRNISTLDKVYYGGFSGYDDTPRKGTAGAAFSRLGAKEFEENVRLLLKKNEALGNEYVFINAWNEWGESMYLEPDEDMGYQYLEAVRGALDTYGNESEIIGNSDEKASNESGLNAVIDCERSYSRLLNSWLTLKEENKNLEVYFKRHEYYNIALYGIGILGKHMISELKNSSITIRYGIDRKSDNIHQYFPVYQKEDKLPDVDVIVVCVSYDYVPIYQYLRKKVNCPIISLAEIIDETAV